MKLGDVKEGLPEKKKCSMCLGNGHIYTMIEHDGISHPGTKLQCPTCKGSRFEDYKNLCADINWNQDEDQVAYEEGILQGRLEGFSECKSQYDALELELDVEELALFIKDLSWSPKFQSLDQMTLSNARDVAQAIAEELPTILRLRK